MNRKARPHAKTRFLAFFLAGCCITGCAFQFTTVLAQETTAPPAETPAEPAPTPEQLDPAVEATSPPAEPMPQAPAAETPPPVSEPDTVPAPADAQAPESPAPEGDTPPAEPMPAAEDPAPEPQPSPAESAPTDAAMPAPQPEAAPAPMPEVAPQTPPEAPPDQQMAPIDSQEPAPAPPIDPAKLTQIARDWEQSYPVARPAFFSIANQFGGIRVDTWDSPVVRVTAKITTSATTPEAAQAFADAIRIEEAVTEEEIRIATVYPEVTDANGPYSVDFDVVVPEDIELDIRNQAGDVAVANANGPVTIDVMFGAVELKNLGNFVRAQAKGKFPFVADGLRRGGIFQLRDAPATFANISGQLTVTNRFAPVEIRSPGEVTTIDVQAELEDIHLYLPASSHPDLQAVAIDGAVISDIPLDQQAQGTTVVGRQVNVDATQRMHLQATFGTVHIHRDGEIMIEPVPADAPEVVQETLPQQRFDVAADGELIVTAIAGDIHITGWDEAYVAVDRRSSARLKSAGAAPEVLGKMTLTAEASATTLNLTTAAPEDLTALDVLSAQLDLTIHVPKTLNIRVRAASGLTRITDTFGRIDIEQTRGSIVIERATGNLDLSNQQGNVDVLHCTGPIGVSCFSGTVTLLSPAADVEVGCVDGKIVLENPQGAVTIRSKKGDVRIIAVDMIGGEYHVTAEDGNISMVAPQEPEAVFHLNVNGGTIYSRLPVNGSIEGPIWALNSKPAPGTPRVWLETIRGNIILD